MGQVYERLDERLRAFLAAQHLFFVATAPSGGEGHVNVSPKGYADTFTVLDDTTVAYLDLTGSGIETVAHVRENGRLTLMFCSFDAAPKILRLYGRGEVVDPGDRRWPGLLARFGSRAGARCVVVLHLERVTDSCGYAVPRFDFAGERDVLERSHRRRGVRGLAAYRAERNRVSIDGLPGARDAADPGGTADAAASATRA